MDAEPVIGIARHHELPAPHGQQVIVPQDAPDLLRSHHEAGALDQRSDAPVSMIAMLQRGALYGVSQSNFRLAGRLPFPVPIKACPAHRGQLAHPLDR